MSYSWKVQVHRSWDEIDDPAFIKQWKQWVDVSSGAHVFNHPSLVKAWTDTYRSLQDIQPLYILAESEDTTVFLPLVLWRRNWKNAFVRWIVPAGYSDYDYHDPLVIGANINDIIEPFWMKVENYLSNNFHKYYDKAFFEGIRIPGITSAWKKDHVECPNLDLLMFGDFERFYSSMKKSLRKDINRQKRRLSQLGDIRYYVYKDHESSLAIRSLKHMLEVHSKRWPRAYKAPGFHENVIRYCLPESILHFSELKIDDLVISWRFCFLYKNRFYSYMPAFFEKYSSFSPNKVHRIYDIENCFNRKVKIFDYLRGAHQYKEELTLEKVPLFKYEANSRCFLSRFRMSLFNIMQKIKVH